MSFWSRITGKSTTRSVGRAAPAPIITDPYSRGLEKEFRLLDDPENVIRINQRPPAGLPRKLEEFVSVAGITQPDTLSNALAFISGSNRKVELVRIPDHPVDPNAIEVIGRWTEVGAERTGRLGYVPANVAAEIAQVVPEILIGATIKIMYGPTTGRIPGVRLDIWAPKRRRV